MKNTFFIQDVKDHIMYEKRQPLHLSILKHFTNCNQNVFLVFGDNANYSFVLMQNFIWLMIENKISIIGCLKKHNIQLNGMQIN